MKTGDLDRLRSQAFVLGVLALAINVAFIVWAIGWGYTINRALIPVNTVAVIVLVFSMWYLRRTHERCGAVTHKAGKRVKCLNARSHTGYHAGTLRGGTWYWMEEA